MTVQGLPSPVQCDECGSRLDTERQLIAGRSLCITCQCFQSGSAAPDSVQEGVRSPQCGSHLSSSCTERQPSPAPLEGEASEQDEAELWKRLWDDYENDRLQPAPVRLGNMPPHARPIHRAIAADIALLLGLLRADGGTFDAVPYSCSFAVRRGHAPNNRQANDALTWLRANRVIAGAGALKPRRGNQYGLRLYRAPAEVVAVADVVRLDEARKEASA